MHANSLNQNFLVIECGKGEDKAEKDGLLAPEVSSIRSPAYGRNSARAKRSKDETPTASAKLKGSARARRQSQALSPLSPTKRRGGGRRANHEEVEEDEEDEDDDLGAEQDEDDDASEVLQDANGLEPDEEDDDDDDVAEEDEATGDGEADD
jgi:hypothetical protein